MFYHNYTNKNIRKYLEEMYDGDVVLKRIPRKLKKKNKKEGIVSVNADIRLRASVEYVTIDLEIE